MNKCTSTAASRASSTFVIFKAVYEAMPGPVQECAESRNLETYIHSNKLYIAVNIYIKLV